MGDKSIAPSSSLHGDWRYKMASRSDHLHTYLDEEYIDFFVQQKKKTDVFVVSFELPCHYQTVILAD